MVEPFVEVLNNKAFSQLKISLLLMAPQKLFYNKINELHLILCTISATSKIILAGTIGTNPIQHVSCTCC